MTREAYEQLKGRSVEFLVRDIYLPDPAAILSELHDGDTLKGIVVDLSDDARDENAAFLVVEVKETIQNPVRRVPILREPCIVAVERILRVSAGDPEAS